MHRRRTVFSANHFLFISLLVFGAYIFNSYPIIVFWFVWTLIIFGAILLFVSLLWIGKYNNIFEHEPTEFFGRSTTGKQSRNILSKGINTLLNKRFNKRAAA